MPTILGKILYFRIGKTTWGRFREKFEITEKGCWIPKHHDNDGRSKFSLDGKSQYGHLAAFEVMSGRGVKAGQNLDHYCNNGDCWNPFHIVETPPLENLKRRIHNFNRWKTSCPKGHLYDEENTYWDKKMRRSCKKCKLAADRRYKERKNCASY